MPDDAIAYGLRSPPTWSKSSIRTAVADFWPFLTPNMDILTKRRLHPTASDCQGLFLELL
jgi:hypothetical protein